VPVAPPVYHGRKTELSELKNVPRPKEDFHYILKIRPMKWMDLS